MEDEWLSKCSIVFSQNRNLKCTRIIYMVLYDYCLEFDRKDLIAQWNSSKNPGLTLKDLTHGSKRKVWWRCDKGHEWFATVKSRVEGCGCPVCARRAVNSGENDLCSTHPSIAMQWHPSKNAQLKPSDVLAGTQRRVWWCCERGHEWRATVASRTMDDTGCPICANRIIIQGENDLGTLFPNVAKQWHVSKNDGLTPGMISPHSNRKVWWRCSAGHEYQRVVSAQTDGAGCPYCANKRVLAGFNDLSTTNPGLAKQWHATLNGSLKPGMVTAGSTKKVWWQCDLGHEYQALITARNRGTGCPYCAGRKVWIGFNDLATKEPTLAKEWHPTLNGELTPEMVTVGCHKKVWWKCSDGHVWKAVIESRATRKKCGCPVCAGVVRKNEANK